MNGQTTALLRILLDPRITATPLRVLYELRRRGVRRLPATVDDELGGGLASAANTLTFLRQWLDGEMLTRHRGQWVLNSFLPPFPGPAFDRLFTNLLSGRRLSPVSAYLAVTAQCPYDCWHCSLRHRQRGHLSTSQWQDVIAQATELGASIVGFTGGEPLTRADLPDLVRTATDRGAATIVFSSGAGFTTTTAQHLADAGLWAFCVSLDHPDAAEHDRRRGAPGAFDRALAALELAGETGFYTMTGTVATPELAGGDLLECLYAIARAHDAQEFRIVEPMPCGRLADGTDDTWLTPAAVDHLRAFHRDTNRRQRLPKVCAFNQIESPEIFGCGGGTQHFFVDTAGEVCPCDFTPLSFGNLTAWPLADIWTRMTTALGNPRRHCFCQRHRELIARHATGNYPLPPAVSEAICAAAGPDQLPEYFALLCGTAQQQTGG